MVKAESTAVAAPFSVYAMLPLVVVTVGAAKFDE